MSVEISGTENGIDVDERRSDSSANETSGLVTAAEQCRRDELRARYEGFEFRVPTAGRVLVTNVSYGDDAKDEHRYVVTVENGVVWSCTCPHHQHRAARCKHMRATENTDAVILAATATDEEGR